MNWSWPWGVTQPCQGFGEFGCILIGDAACGGIQDGDTLGFGRIGKITCIFVDHGQLRAVLPPVRIKDVEGLDVCGRDWIQGRGFKFRDATKPRGSRCCDLGLVSPLKSGCIWKFRSRDPSVVYSCHYGYDVEDKHKPYKPVPLPTSTLLTGSNCRTDVVMVLHIYHILYTDVPDLQSY